MLNGVFFVCLSLGLFGAGCPLNCDWMEHKFKQHSEEALEQLDALVSNSTNTDTDTKNTEDAAAQDTVTFPQHLYNLMFNASAEDRLAFTVQILNKTADLFDQYNGTASWDANVVEDFVNVITQQTDGLHACIESHTYRKTKKLNLYFMRLSNEVLEKMGFSAEAWELIRREAKANLMKVHQLVSPLIKPN